MNCQCSNCNQKECQCPSCPEKSCDYRVYDLCRREIQFQQSRKYKNITEIDHAPSEY